MAHLVTNQNNAKGDLVLKGVPAWHGLGTVINSDQLTTEEVLQFSGLDFQVEKSPNIHRMGETDVVSKESFFTYRTDKNIVLGSSVGSTYTVLQNTEALDLLDIIKQDGTIHWESAGALDNGRLTFIAAKVDAKIAVNGYDEVQPYVVFSNSHDGKSAIRAYFTNVRVVCNNTLQFSVNQSQQMHRIRHTKNASAKLTNAFEVMGLMKKNLEVSKEAYEEMSRIKFKQNEFWNYIGNIFLEEKEKTAVINGVPIKDVITDKKAQVFRDVVEYAEIGVGQKEAGIGTAWWAYNAITGYESNVKTFKSQQDRFEGLLFEKDSQRMLKAFDLALNPQKIEPLNRIITPSNLNYN